jgi:hypothetical protein
MTPADRERIEAVIAEQLKAHRLQRTATGATPAIRAMARNTAMAAHELGRESALGEIETALRELGAEVRLTWKPQLGAHCVVAVDGFRAHATRATFDEALLAAIDAVNEMRAAQALANRGVL